MNLDTIDINYNTQNEIKIKQEVVDTGNNESSQDVFLSTEHCSESEQRESMEVSFDSTFLQPSRRNSAVKRKSQQITGHSSPKGPKENDLIIMEPTVEQFFSCKEIKAENIWEEPEMTIIDYQHISYESPIRTEPDVESFHKSEDLVDSSGTVTPHLLRRSSRKRKNPVNYYQFEEDKGINVKTDDMITDPSYSPLEHEEDCLEDDNNESQTLKKNRRSHTLHNLVKKGKHKNKCKIKYKYWRKKFACFYCNRMVGKLTRHLIRNHSDESEVKHFNSLQVGSDERKMAINSLKEKGKLCYDKEADSKYMEERKKKLELKKKNKQEKQKNKILKNDGNKKGTSKNKPTKKNNICMYCMAKSNKLSKHFQYKHKEEPEVKYFMSLAKGSKERRITIQLLTNRGNFAHNKKVLQLKKGVIIPSRSDQCSSEKYRNYVPCIFCLGFFAKKTFYLHIKSCPSSDERKLAINALKEKGRLYYDKEADNKYLEELQNNYHKKATSKTKQISKKNICIYCMAKGNKLSKHFQLKHKEESEVKQFMSLAKGSKERRTAIQLLTNRGNFAHNKKVLQLKEGDIITSRSDQCCSEKYSNYSPCKFCLGFFRNQNLNNHIKSCPGRDNLSIITENVSKSFDKLKLSRKFACCYCNKMVQQLPRHLIRNHSNESDVKHLASLHVGSEERKMAVKALKEKGRLRYDKEDDNKHIEEQQENFVVRKKNKEKRHKSKIPKNKDHKKAASETKKMYKKNICIYCTTKIHKLSKHFQEIHKEEPEVKNFMSLAKGSKERRTALQLLTRRGNFAYNKKIFKLKEGDIIPSRLSKKCGEKYGNYLPCNFCLGFFRNTNLSNHIKSCPSLDSLSIITENKTESFDKLKLILSHIAKSLLPFGEVMEDILNTDSNEINQQKNKLITCFFCKKVVTKFTEHLLIRHSNETEVKNIASLAKGSKERFREIQALRKKGNLIKDTSSCYFNNSSAEQKDGMKKSEVEGRNNVIPFPSPLLEYPEHKKTCTEEVIHLLNTKFNDIFSIAKGDNLIIKYGVLLLVKKVDLRKITFTMCLLARVVARMNVLDKNIITLRDCLKPLYFETLLKELFEACANFKSQSFLKEKMMIVALKYCCIIVKCEGLLQNDSTILRDIDEFLSLLNKHLSKSYLKQMDQHHDSELTKGTDQPISRVDSQEEEECFVKPYEISEIVSDTSLFQESANDVEFYGQLYYRKKDACFFCYNVCEELPAHFIYNHGNEPEIKQLIVLNKGSTERAMILKALRGKGNFLHNKKVIEENTGFMIAQCGNIPIDKSNDFLPCEHCYGFIHRRRLSYHNKRCILNPFTKEKVREFCFRPTFIGTLLLFNYKDESESLQLLFEKMTMNDVNSLIIRDKIMLKFGSFMVYDHGLTKKVTQRQIFNKLQQLGKLVLKSYDYNKEIETLQDCFQPENFTFLLKAAKAISLEKNNAQAYFRNLGMDIQITCKMLKFEYDFQRVETKVKDIIQFMIMFSKEWTLSEEDFGTALIGNDICKRRRWSSNEERALFRIFSYYINCKKLPGKLEIEEVLHENECLYQRDWISVKSKLCTMINNKDSSLDHHNAKDALNIESRSLKITVDDSLKSSEVRNHNKENSCNIELNSKIKTMSYEDSPTNCEYQLNEVVNEKINLVSSKTRSNLNKEENNILNEPHSCDKPVIFTEIHKSLDSECGFEKYEERTYLVIGETHSKDSKTQKERSSNLHQQYSEQLDSSHRKQTDEIVESVDTMKTQQQNTEVDKCGVDMNETTIKIKEPNNTADSCILVLFDVSASNDMDANVNKEEEEIYDNSNSKVPSPKSRTYRQTKSKNCLKINWTVEENNAIIKFFKYNIKNKKVPSKAECINFIEEYVDCLQARNWVSVKSKVHNMIVSYKRNGKCLTTNNNVSKLSCDSSDDFTSNEGIQDDNCQDTSIITSSRSTNLSPYEIIRKTPNSTRKSKKNYWSVEENEIITSFFNQHIKKSIVPGKQDCQNCIASNSCLQSRSWVTVKSKVHNLIVQKRKKS